ncbi:TetR/AcrR family transcriptional regulator [Bacillus sp. FJAT-50079]|uniref:TetR/AcrR family transcriptional regulator n=1 Tax=Bacillus sp. FJAT-50079 TaxID=2833577 RepID=UPI001BC9EEB6|nr:TetR/AcrR family transcriptional regulator [Bacillus sp. FJAT-50079]MBS4209874.1 TetR/AcrR family transcriptional regulator [Bacillus sp. FJAT-50079]
MLAQSTSDRIINAAIELISEKGYKAATTKAIAQLAGVNEVTLFRHFGNKHGILKAIVQKFSYGPHLQKVMHEKVVWDVEIDLYNFSIEYQSYIMSIKDFVLIGFKEADAFPEINEEIANVPLFIKNELIDYFREMKRKRKIIDINIEATAMALIAINFGHFISRARLGDQVTELTTDQLIKTSVTIFSRGLTL